MNAISVNDAQKLARLSAISLTDEELEVMRQELTDILSYVEQLQGVDTEGIEPTYQVHGLETVVRSDEIIDYGVEQRDLLANAPEQDAGTIVVPRVLE